ncbi:hypothetical protein Bca52824_081214 [Brassica carinata]|uniref:Uncharacterized protein n=1 Tax=Brassica carinata TaxID=52824 RepID=A0A8X7PIA5_BRACI|nr:hypothetical protein Bca52824_081214 [Brassica carinata]
MVCNQFIHFLLINEDFSPPPLTEATVYIWRQGSQEKLRSFFKQRNSSQGKQRSRRASPAPSSPTYGGKIQIFDCLKSQGEPSFYLFGFIMYCNHSCESAKNDNGSEGRQNFNSGVWEKATHKEVYGSDICLEAEGRLKTEVRRLTNISQADDCQRLGYGCFG